MVNESSSAPEPNSNSSNFSKTSIDINRDLLDKFKEIYPQRGAVKHFINKVLEIFVESHEGTLNDEIKRAVMSAEETLQDNRSDENASE